LFQKLKIKNKFFMPVEKRTPEKFLKKQDNILKMAYSFKKDIIFQTIKFTNVKYIVKIKKYIKK